MRHAPHAGIHTGSGCVLCKVYDKTRSISQARARTLFPEVFKTYKQTQKTSHAGRFSLPKWLAAGGTQDQIKQITSETIVVPTVNTFTGGLFNMKEWVRGQKKGPGKTARGLVNNVKDSAESREDRGLQVITRFLPDYTIEDHREEAGPDFIAVPKLEGSKPILVDVKSGNVASAAQVRIALQMEQEGVEFWMLDPDNEKAMKITKDCEFIPTQYRVYAPQSK